MFVRKLLRDDWQAYKVIRLEAISRHPDVYGEFAPQEAGYPDAWWIDSLTTDRHAIFGLFDRAALVGCTGVFTDRNDASGNTALLGASYIRDAYRGQRLSRLFYQARIDWAKAQGTFDRIVVGHRDGNERSRRANQAFGFTFTHKENHVFGDGTAAILFYYEMRI